MKTLSLRALGLAALTFSSVAVATSVQLVKNYCNETLYITLYSNGTTVGPFELPYQQAYISDIVGQGNTCTVSKEADIWSSSVGKLILGTSSDNGILYWSVNNNSGDPFVGQTWDIDSDGSTANVCGNTTTYGDNVYACADQDVTLTLSAC